MKKKCLCICLAVLICAAVAPAMGEGAKFLARAYNDFNIREKPLDKARRVRQVLEGEELEVLEYGEEWSLVRLERAKGYCRTRWLWMFRSLNPLRYTAPGYSAPLGVARMKEAAFITVKGYRGNELQPDDLVVVQQADNGESLVNMMRSQAPLAPGTFSLQEFTAWEQALPGDLLGGASSFYTAFTGGRLAGNRQKNILAAASRVSGQVIPAQGLFSFNALCEPYRKSNGYELAPKIGGDGVGYGGGVCQVSTAVFHAAMGLPMLIREWEIHQKIGVGYALAGLDAAVSAYSDLMFQNLLPYAVRVEVLPQNGALTVLIFRAETEEEDMAAQTGI